MKIGELARASGVSTKTIRYYESLGLLPEPERGPNGYRIYDHGAAERLRFIRDAQATGLTLTEIGSILDLRDQGDATCRHVIELLQRHLDELDRHIASLHATRSRLGVLTARARRLDPTDCTDPHRCQTITPDPQVDRPVSTELHGGPNRQRHTHSTARS